LWVKTSYIASKKNVEADTASRIINLDTEWELSTNFFNQIVKKFGEPSVDLFASRIKNVKYSIPDFSIQRHQQ